MKLGDSGEARVRGYLYVLGRSLRSFLPVDVVRDALSELESHLRERIEQTDPEPDERRALEQGLGELGSPLRVAQAYSAEMTLEEAVATGGFAATARALWQGATTQFVGFCAALALLAGYLIGIGFLAVALIKPVLPRNTGLIVIDGVPRGFGVYAQLGDGIEVWGGYWIIPMALVLGLAVLVVTHRSARWMLAWRRRRARTWTHGGVLSSPAA